MTRRLVLAFALVVASCGGGAGGTPPPTLSGTLHITGGIAGVDETWSLAADRIITGPAGETGTMSDAGLEAVREAMAAADFFALDAEYLPADTCCDRFTYVISLSDGSRTHTITTLDDAGAPPSLVVLIETFRSALREAASIG